MSSSSAPSETPDEVLARFDRAGGPVDLTDVAEALRAGAAEGEPELWKADRLAAEIRPFPGNPSPWGGYFGPRFSATYENGEVVDSPPLAAVDTDVLDAWRLRADGLTTPTLKAHYADLIWDLGPKVLARGANPTSRDWPLMLTARRAAFPPSSVSTPSCPCAARSGLPFSWMIKPLWTRSGPRSRSSTGWR